MFTWKGNGEREEEDDLTSQEGKGAVSGGEFPFPTARGDDHCSLEVEADREQAESRAEARGEERDTTVIVDTVSVMESTENSGSEQPGESPAPQRTEDEVPKTSEPEVPVAVVEVRKDDVSLPPPPSVPIPPTSVEVPISKVEEVSVEHVQSEKGEEVAVSGDTPPSIEHKRSDAVDTASPVELSVPIPEEVFQASDVPVETLEVVESVAEAPSSKTEEKIVPLIDATSEQPDLSVESRPPTETREIAGTAEVWSIVLRWSHLPNANCNFVFVI